MFYIQLIGLLAFCILVLSFYKKNVVTILTYQTTANFAYSIHYFLLGGLSGAFISLITIFRNIIFMKLKRNKELFVAIFILLYIIITIIFYENFYSLFPMIANSLYLIAINKGNKKALLIGAIIGSVCWIIYSIFVFSYVSIATESILIISNVIQLIKINRTVE